MANLKTWSDFHREAIAAGTDDASACHAADVAMEAAGWSHCPYCGAGLDRTAETGGKTFIHILTRDEQGRISKSRPCTRRA